jgi:hypothetical protein
MLDELKERNILKLILMVRFAFATLDVGRPICMDRCATEFHSNLTFDLSVVEKGRLLSGERK